MSLTLEEEEESHNARLLSSGNAAPCTRGVSILPGCDVGPQVALLEAEQLDPGAFPTSLLTPPKTLKEPGVVVKPAAVSNDDSHTLYGGDMSLTLDESQISQFFDENSNTTNPLLLAQYDNGKDATITLPPLVQCPAPLVGPMASGDPASLDPKEEVKSGARDCGSPLLSLGGEMSQRTTYDSEMSLTLTDSQAQPDDRTADTSQMQVDNDSKVTETGSRSQTQGESTKGTDTSVPDDSHHMLPDNGAKVTEVVDKGQGDVTIASGNASIGTTPHHTPALTTPHQPPSLDILTSIAGSKRPLSSSDIVSKRIAHGTPGSSSLSKDRIKSMYHKYIGSKEKSSAPSTATVATPTADQHGNASLHSVSA